MANGWGNLAQSIGGSGNLWGGLAQAGAGLAGAYLANKSAEEASRQTTTSAPWQAQQPYLQNIMGQAQNLYRQTRDYPMYPGQMTAGWSPLQQQADVAQLNAANWLGGGILPSATQGIAGLAGQTARSAVSEPGIGQVDPSDYLRQALTGQVDTAAYDPIAEQLRAQSKRGLEETLPSIRAAATAAGAKGSSREGVAEGLTRRGAQESLDRNLAQLYGGAYQQAQSKAGQAASQALEAARAREAVRSSVTGQAGGLLGQLPGMAQAQMGMLGVPSRIGAQQRALQQAGIDEQMQRYMYPQEQAQRALQQYSGTIYGSPGGGTTTTQSPYSRTGSLIGGGLAGLGLGQQLFGGGQGGLFGYGGGGGQGSPQVNQLLAQSGRGLGLA